MEPNRILQAYEAFNKLADDARVARGLFEVAREPMPTPLKWFFGMIPNGTPESQAKMVVPEMPQPHRPPDAADDWIWIPAKELSVNTLSLGVLRGSDTPMAPKHVVEGVRHYSPNSNSGSIYNVGPRLDGKLIRRTEDGWLLIDKKSAPVLHEDYAWGPRDVFSKQELASHRRSVILHLLATAHDGLMTMQILRQLQEMPTVCRAPVSKELVQDDMEILQKEKRVRRIGNTKKWTVPDRS